MVDLPPPEDPQPPYGRTRHPYFMHDMIRRQAVAVRGTLASAQEQAANIPVPPDHGDVGFVGIGTSFHAALAASQTAAAVWKRSRGTHALSAFDVLNDPEVLSRLSGAVVFSASGDTWVTIQAAQLLNARKIPWVLVSARQDGTLSRLTPWHVFTEHADEESWTHTASYTAAQCGALALSRCWGGLPVPESNDDIVREVDLALDTEQQVLDRVAAEAERERFLLVGSGFGEATACESALKIREAYGRFAASAGIEELLHGVLPSLDERAAVVGFSTTELERRRLDQALAAVRELGCAAWLVDSSGGSEGEGVVSLPTMPPECAAIAQVIPLQFYAYWGAVNSGRNPDVMGLDDPKTLAARRTFGI